MANKKIFLFQSQIHLRFSSDTFSCLKNSDFPLFIACQNRIFYNAPEGQHVSTRFRPSSKFWTDTVRRDEKVIHHHQAYSNFPLARFTSLQFPGKNLADSSIFPLSGYFCVSQRCPGSSAVGVVVFVELCLFCFIRRPEGCYDFSCLSSCFLIRFTVILRNLLSPRSVFLAHV